MCLGIPAQLVAGDTGHPDLAMVDMGGVSRAINLGLLDERPGPGDWVLVHMGFALQTMTAGEARDTPPMSTMARSGWPVSPATS